MELIDDILNHKKCQVTARFSLILVYAVLVLFSVENIGSEPATYVYYGHVPMSTSMWDSWYDLIDGEEVRFTIPPDCGLLEAVGTADSTTIEVWDISGQTKLTSATVNRLEKFRHPIPIGTFFKVVSNNPVAAALFGGQEWGSGTRGGSSTFYPSVEGGFVGKEFILTQFPSSWAPACC